MQFYDTLQTRRQCVLTVQEQPPACTYTFLCIMQTINTYSMTNLLSGLPGSSVVRFWCLALGSCDPV